VGARELIFEHRANEAIVEKACGPVDDVQGFGLRVVSLHPTRSTEHCAVG
jgi:hypothetical protein